MKPFDEALKFIRENEKDTLVLIFFLEQMLVSAPDKFIEMALNDTKTYQNEKRTI